MKRAVCILLMLTFQHFYSQNNFPEVPKDYTWLQTNQANLDISEVTFVNWNAGGSNSISALLNVLSELRYQDTYYKWRNSAKLRYGINKQENQRLRKTEDELELISTFGFRNDTLTNWYFSGRANFKTQFTNGYQYPNRDNEISKLMAPGYLFLGGGTEYGKNLEKFSVYMSPLTFKATFVLDADLSNAGSFGVTPAVIDAEGNIIKQGERVRTEMGVLFTNFYEKEIFENIRVRHNLSLYSDYINNFGNIDVDWEVVFDFRVNQYVKATLGSHIKYDNDIKILEETAVEDEFIENGAKVQWKQLLGVGVVVGF
ncbi:DUF3078 domain-containing protein [Subsaximicrobium wynnwilliamsii]|uniref:DUF3078 domain-containing protein n=1 Tax=Subsaximicrobium wynnwilliamsii TaxID=291179 RepID=A0A5C6ZBW7_9FLAO|nr:DUF3078 domain-containing protein [Subsaximicrobium wynnwilliamsii]TXD81850.1 DUF3078 domain-containing protein [Subsaximicrobium wynnwilliamsii]TXD87519.1 DUF3078 domain-containing protein [Subsaximicrobium wynnwilliamsii]TXE01202.1 DUF3078 domain-containing protein [Subsaximicrobium wynnwilliamsii]